MPARTGGLNITLPGDSAHEYERSKAMSDCLSDNGSIVAENRQFALAAALKKETTDCQSQRVIAKAKEEKGSSCWLIAPPIKRYPFNLTKSEFRDDIALRYG